ncbi:MAG: hypothetical protein KZQ88_08785, partial [Candidatus Thiodiazotropha sp. (ex Dulcina madagascariensis)]|nr:hypothetical protein [Candidatus Thiodiazotropha sp. (ex Dulcina madagascariensis)]MCU7928015.1 hypothetical protein [Candidatus Thiodiazotropha sp. (ex Dulcina madagascariensis)]
MTVNNKSYSLTALLLLVFSLAGHADVRLPEGEYYQDIDDLKVKVLGGEITIRRTWYKGQWFSNRAWEPLTFAKHSVVTTPGGVITEHEYVTGVERNGDKYQPIRFTVSNAIGNATACYGLGGNTQLEQYTEAWKAACFEERLGDFNQIGYTYGLNGEVSAFEVGDKVTRTDTGYRWTNKEADWIDYDPQGVIQSYGNQAGATATFTYDANGRRASVRDRLGNTVFTYEYNPQGQLRFVRGEANRQVEYRYTGDQLTEVIDARGKTWRYTYTSPDPESKVQLASQTDPRNRLTELSYTKTKQLQSETLTDPDGNRRQTRYVYDYDAGRKAFYVQITGPQGEVTERFYDRDSILARKLVNGQEVFTRERDYVNGEIIHILRDRRRLKTVKEHDDWKNLIKTTHPDGTVTSASYEPRTTQLNERIDELGRITRYAYHANGLLFSMTEAADTPQARITEYQ